MQGGSNIFRTFLADTKVDVGSNVSPIIQKKCSTVHHLRYDFQLWTENTSPVGLYHWMGFDDYDMFVL